MVDNLEYFRVRDRKIANVWSSYGLELDDRWLGGGDFRVRERQKAMVWSSFDLELDIKMIVGEISGRETWK